VDRTSDSGDQQARVVAMAALMHYRRSDHSMQM